MAAPKINIVVPLYNEEQVFADLVARLTKIMDASALTIEVIMIDDGSRDSTAMLMKQLSLVDSRFQSVILSRNFGHQLALSAGLSKVNATDAVMVIDGDLQDPPELLEEFYKYYKDGYDVVYAVRKKRKEGFFKKLSYALFYKILKSISYIDIPLDSGDFSLISVRVVENLNQMPEESRFIRGMRSWIGYKQIGVEYERSERASGESKYTLGKLIKLALNGIFNFSEYPIKLITNLGLFAIFVSSIYLVATLYKKIVYNTTPEGFTAIVFLITLFGGIQLMAIGVIGEYILRIFFQVKGRPLFIIKEFVRDKTIQRRNFQNERTKEEISQ